MVEQLAYIQRAKVQILEKVPILRYRKDKTPRLMTEGLIRCDNKMCLILAISIKIFRHNEIRCNNLLCDCHMLNDTYCNLHHKNNSVARRSNNPHHKLNNYKCYEKYICNKLHKKVSV